MFSTSRTIEILGIAVLAIALAVQATAVYGQPAVTPWPMWGQNAQRTGECPVNGPQKGDPMWVAGTEGAQEIAIGEKAIYVLGPPLYAINFDGSLRWRDQHRQR